MLPDYVMMIGVLSAILAACAGIASIWAGYLCVRHFSRTVLPHTDPLDHSLHKGVGYHDRHYDDDPQDVKQKHPFKAWNRFLVLGLHGATFLSECCYLYMLISTSLIGDKKEYWWVYCLEIMGEELLADSGRNPA